MRDQLVGDVPEARDDDDGRAPRRGADRGGTGSSDDIDAAAKQSVDRSHTRGNVNEIAVEAVLLEKPEVLGDPQRRPRPGDRSIGDGEWIEFLVLRTERGNGNQKSQTNES